MFGLESLHKTLLQLEPETAHDLALRGVRVCQRTHLPLRLLRRRCRVEDPRLEQQLWGRRFSNPIGLAAGYDKNGEVVHGMAALGFGFVEVGTVTPLPQRGNPKPRLFRHRDERSLRNALGFNNRGAEAMAASLGAQQPFPVPVGINIGKNRRTDAAEAHRDYVTLVERLATFADYFVINISSPNTPGLRDLQAVETTVDLLRRCRDRTERPVLVKLAPDLADAQAVELAEAAASAGASGVVVTNTTIDYSLLPGVEERGGLSGRVLRQRSFEMLRLLAPHLGESCRLISVGGVESAEDVYRRLRSGACLVQVYTALVYQGPMLIAGMLRGVLDLMQRDGFGGIEEVIGTDVQHSSTATP